MEQKFKNPAKNCYGPTAKEKWRLFLQDKKSNLPFQIENIGITYPNPQYYVERVDSNLFIFEYVVSGKGYLEFEDKIYDLEPGDFYIIEPHKPHADYSDKNDPYQKIWVNFTSNCFAQVFNAYGLSGINVFKNSNVRPFFDELLLISEKSNHSDDISIDVSNVLFEILHVLAKQIRNPVNNVAPVALLIKNMLDGAVFKEISLNDIANEIHYSKKQINRIFKRDYNITPYEYYLNLKLSFAKKYLSLTELSIKEISEKLHFENQYYFSNLFKKKTGLSPLKYRRSHRRIQ